MNRAIVFLVAAMLIFPLLSVNSVHKAKKPKFSGTWTLSEDKSEFGEYGRMWASEKLIITHKGKKLHVERFSTGGAGEEIHLIEDYTLDGKECMNTILEESTKKSTVSWSDDKTSIAIDSFLDLRFDGQQMEVVSIEILSIDENGTLIINSTSSSVYGEMSVVYAYDKAEDTTI